jgi:hypothetical protein
MKTTEWNWIEIKGIDSLPDFEKQVLLYQRNRNKHYAIIGSLRAISKDGYQWTFNNFNDIFNMFGLDFTGKEIEKGVKFNPTHWCKIEIPKSKIEYNDLFVGIRVKVTFIEEGKKIEEIGTVDVLNPQSNTFILRHEDKKNSMRVIEEWETITRI